MPRASPYGQDGWNHLREISTQSAYINSSASLERGNRFQGLQSGFRQKLRPHKLRLDDPALRNIEVRTNSVRLLVICGPAFRLFIYACAIIYPFFEIVGGPRSTRNTAPANDSSTSYFDPDQSYIGTTFLPSYCRYVLHSYACRSFSSSAA